MELCKHTVFGKKVKKGKFRDGRAQKKTKNETSHAR